MPEAGRSTHVNTPKAERNLRLTEPFRHNRDKLSQLEK